MSCILQYVNYTSMELIFESFNPVCPESAYITPCYAHVLNHFSHVWLCESLCTVAFQAPLCMGFSRHEYLSGLPYSVPGALPNSGIKPASLTSPALAGGFFIPRFRWGHVKWPTPPRSHSQRETGVPLFYSARNAFYLSIQADLIFLQIKVETHIVPVPCKLLCGWRLANLL